MTRLLLNLATGTLEVDGDEALVKAVYDDIKPLLKAHLAHAKPDPVRANHQEETPENPEAEEKKRRAVAKRTGPSCASRILELDGYFSELRDTKAVVGALATKGHNYETKHVAAALINLTKAGKLRRIQKDGGWMYQNP